MRRITALLLLILTLFVAACGDGALPFPTPAQHDLVVLTRNGPLSYLSGEDSSVGGLERDLIEAFAQELGVGVSYRVVAPGEFEAQVRRGDYHLAAAWLSPHAEGSLQATPPIFLTRDILAQHEASLPLTKLEQLAGKTVHALASTRQAATLHRLAHQIPDLRVIEVGEGDILKLLQALGERKVDYVAMDSRIEDIANQFVPSLRSTLKLSDERPIIWQLGPRPNSEFIARANAFVERVQHDGTLARIEERYFGHVRRLTQADVTRFLAEIETTLPKFRRHFESAEALTGIDWRLTAAIAYQESHWDPNAISPTNVRGIMMLTEDTADHLGVGNRLNPRESIIAGARYLVQLKEALDPEIEEPDRTWLALSAYNLGPGNAAASRRLARELGANPNLWFEMKRILPLLAQRKYYERIKSGRARGGEAVILVENIRSYYDILLRHESPWQAPPTGSNPAAELSASKHAKPGRKR
ncbi:MAG: membrane-bound lytic murein transglycosylase MltF [Azonexus sp.]|nr:membrane-bound lytic murein transglycosylase MltF [Azonexus sp.]MCK6412337.1 membrane-bound lytic murein transglycosylase MltF [Azonexus sp.]